MKNLLLFISLIIASIKERSATMVGRLSFFNTALFAVFISAFCTNLMAYQPLFIPFALTLFVLFQIPVNLARGCLSMAVNAAPITFAQGQLNPGGTAGIVYYFFEEDLESWPAFFDQDISVITAFADAVTIPVDDPFVFKSGKCFMPLYTTLEKGRVTSEQIGPRDSKSWKNGFEGSFPGNDSEWFGFLALSSNRRVGCAVPEADGTVKIVGHPRFPAEIMTAKYDSGAAVEDGRATPYTLEAKSGTPAPIYLAPIQLTPTV